VLSLAADFTPVATNRLDLTQAKGGLMPENFALAPVMVLAQGKFIAAQGNRALQPESFKAGLDAVQPDGRQGGIELGDV
jgi:hypothetical protein